MSDNIELRDPTSFGNISYFKAINLHWKINVDFTTNILDCTCTQEFKCIQNGAEYLILDTRDLTIEKVEFKDSTGYISLHHEVKPVEELGQPLYITLPGKARESGTNFQICIQYKTSPKATAIQWLTKEQTLDKTHPFLFTQCQAIHARSLLPCFDTPSNKIKYTAEVTVPNDMVALMSAIKGEDIEAGDGTKTCTFHQKIEIPSYLLALAVGKLAAGDIGNLDLTNTPLSVWSEPGMLQKCKDEFSNVSNMLVKAVHLMGDYVWGRYDILVLPPSFPYGGMENPCITFATPTIVVGDKSLTSVVAHEITHSWTGNLVTNRNWEHFWLNEGFTRFLEGKIIGLLQGEEMRQFMAINGWSDLIDAVNDFAAQGKPEFTMLQPTLEATDPDDVFSSIPYEKGYAFLYYIETLIGGSESFNEFFKSYIQTYKHKTVITEEFKSYLLNYYKDKPEGSRLQEIDWDTWLFGTGMPPVEVIKLYDDTLAVACDVLCQKWVNATEENLIEDNYFTQKEFTSLFPLQQIVFLQKLYQDKKVLSLKHIQKMTEVYNLFASENSEIKFGHLRLCSQAKWMSVDDQSEVDKFKQKMETFLSEQGRMKYIRPLYKEMNKHEMSKTFAVETFKKHRNFYHSIAVKMITQDLGLE